jgi:uncharacterized repeat protein (TIGR03809 family)
MSARQPGLYDSIARRWHALAERRRAHIAELRDSGRWKHYYTAEELLDAVRETVTARDAWATLAGLKQDAAEAIHSVEAVMTRQLANAQATAKAEVQASRSEASTSWPAHLPEKWKAVFR